MIILSITLLGAEFSLCVPNVIVVLIGIFSRWGGGKDKYFAKLGKNMISVYETESFTLIDKKSLKVENVMDFSWSPTDPIIALFVPELGGGNQPAMVSACSDMQSAFVFFTVLMFLIHLFLR